MGREEVAGLAGQIRADAAAVGVEIRSVSACAVAAASSENETTRDREFQAHGTPSNSKRRTVENFFRK